MADQRDFQKGVDYANSKKGTVQEVVTRFNPQEVFRGQRGGYTENPSQTGYYKDTQSDTIALEGAARVEVTKDEDYKDARGNSVPTPGKTVTEGFKTRPVFKISRDEEHMKKAKLIEANASNIVVGESNKNIDCKRRKMLASKTIQVEKTCNEEVRTLRRICDKAPTITTYMKDIVYPNCKATVVALTFRGGCPAGYRSILYSDMLRFRDDDDVNICQKDVTASEGTECFGGYLVYGIIHANRHIQSTERATVPKKMHARIKFSNVYTGSMAVSLVNETTGKIIYESGVFTNGQVVELPFSETQDQVFRFYEPRQQGWFATSGIGVMILYIDHLYREKAANAPVWREDCRDV